jgi:hypothetical protein
VLHSLGRLVERKNLAALTQQMNQIPAVAAAGVENRHAGHNVTPQNLIEDVDIDLPELFLNSQLQWVTVVPLCALMDLGRG